MLELFSRITTFVFDVDGVLTDGTLFVFDNGEQVRRMNIKDGYALQLAVKKGYRVAIFSGANSEAVVNRLKKLGITDVFMNVQDKKSGVQDYIQQHGINWNEVLFMGDDIPDYSVMKEVALPCAPGDAVPEIKQLSKYISSFYGGKGCVRDVIEKVLKLRDDWELDVEIPSK
ncbi:MAG: HAD-IIIA family hydrolase [Chitinophagaceae bacterium]|nr:HAD-IIIA family hydrolase [Chitinophagaceae bacterium]